APLRTSGYNAPAVADLDGDGDLDVMVGVLGGAYNPDQTARANLYYLEQTAPHQWTLRTTQFLSMIDVGSESSPALADLDGDGDLDMVIGNKIDAGSTTGGGLYLYRNRGNARQAEFHEAGRLPIDDGYHPAPAFGDLDGDGKPDMILGTWRDALFYYRNTSTADSIRFSLADSAIVRLTRGSYAMPALADLDGDGDLDLIVGESSGELNYYRNDGTRQAPKFVLVSDAMDSIDVGRRSAPALSDVDGDGDPDLVVGTDAGPPVLFRNEGTARAPRFVQDSTFRPWLPPLSAPALVDVDGDGAPELMAGSSSGGVYYLGPAGPANSKRRK
ncbi:MAG TPA: VCBS repeat-containing protein, partial [Gemmatimonadales bacterium]|nr:VCBS repeat-containing protein [Gemmatimonadales bacterium]